MFVCTVAIGLTCARVSPGTPRIKPTVASQHHRRIAPFIWDLLSEPRYRHCPTSPMLHPGPPAGGDFEAKRRRPVGLPPARPPRSPLHAPALGAGLLRPHHLRGSPGAPRARGSSLAPLSPRARPALRARSGRDPAAADAEDEAAGARPSGQPDRHVPLANRARRRRGALHRPRPAVDLRRGVRRLRPRRQGGGRTRAAAPGRRPGGTAGDPPLLSPRPLADPPPSTPVVRADPRRPTPA